MERMIMMTVKYKQAQPAFDMGVKGVPKRIKEATSLNIFVIIPK